MRSDLQKAIVLVLVVGLAAGCAAGRAFSRAERAARAGDWDLAVTYYMQAVQASPQSAEYKIALERAQLAASRQHLEAAVQLEAKGDLEGAVREYRKASEYDPTNNRAASKVTELQQTIRDRAEASRPRPALEQMRERARQAAVEPLLNPASRDPLRLHFAANVPITDILTFIGQASGINILYDRDLQARQTTAPALDLDGLTLEQALGIVLTTNGLFYRVLNEKTIVVAQDIPGKRQQYEEQVVQTFPISNADVAELQTLLGAILQSGGTAATRAYISSSKSANTITVRGSAAVVGIAARIIEANDKPRAEVVIDIEILEVNRTRAKQYGLNLAQYAVNGQFSPEGAPSAGTGTGTGTGGTGTGTGATTPSSLFNLNTITRGINTSDFYLGVPSFIVRFLESDTQTKLIAKPSLRGAEGAKLTLNLGDEIPVPSTTFLPLVAGGVSTSPSVSYNYRPVGVNLEVTTRVTLEGEIILDLSVESSTRGSDVNISGQNLPAFGSRKVTTRMRLKDGESNLLAGLLRDDERKSLVGFPGAIHVPILKQLFSSNDTQIQQTDIVMLLTPHIIRTQGLTEKDFQPIYIGTTSMPSLGGAPPLISPQGVEPGAATAPPPAAPGRQPGGAAGQPAMPPGSAVPGTVPPPVPAPAPQPAAPAGSTTMPGAGVPPSQPSSLPPGGQPAPPTTAGTTQPAGAAQQAAPATTTAAQVLVTPSGTEFRVGGGPYTVPVTINNVTRLSTISLSLTYNPAAVRVTTVQRGSFMEQGGTQVSFAQQVDSAAGRVDITLSRTGDVVGASGTGVLASLQFEAVAAGSVTFTPSGVATGPAGSVPLQFAPATVTVR